MKSIVILIVIFIASTGQALENGFKCNNGEIVVYKGNNDPMGRPTYQLVLSGQPLRYFLEKDAIDPKHINIKGEFIISVNTYNSMLMGFLSYQTPVNGMHTYRNYWISRRNGDVSLRSTIGNKISGEKEKANWQFHNCL
jgi:hypothetical protein